MLATASVARPRTTPASRRASSVDAPIGPPYRCSIAPATRTGQGPDSSEACERPARRRRVLRARAGRTTATKPRRTAPPVLVRQVRNGVEESVHRGDIVEVDAAGRIAPRARRSGAASSTFDRRSSRSALARADRGRRHRGVRARAGRARDHGQLATPARTSTSARSRRCSGGPASARPGSPRHRGHAARRADRRPTRARRRASPATIRHMCSGPALGRSCSSPARTAGRPTTTGWTSTRPRSRSRRSSRARSGRRRRSSGPRHRRLRRPDATRSRCARSPAPTRSWPIPAAVPANDPRAALAPVAHASSATRCSPTRRWSAGTRDRLDTSVMKALPGPDRREGRDGGAARPRDPARAARADGRPRRRSGMALKIEDGDGYDRGTWAASIEALAQAGVLDGQALRVLGATTGRSRPIRTAGGRRGDRLVRARAGRGAAGLTGPAVRRPGERRPRREAVRLPCRDRPRSVPDAGARAGRLDGRGQARLPAPRQGVPPRLRRGGGAAALPGDPRGLRGDPRPGARGRSPRAPGRAGAGRALARRSRAGSRGPRARGTRGADPARARAAAGAAATGATAGAAGRHGRGPAGTSGPRAPAGGIGRRRRPDRDARRPDLGDARSAGGATRARRPLARPPTTRPATRATPTWSGAAWYGPSSGEYWIINPREYADPRKHGPEYQARARRRRRCAAPEALGRRRGDGRTRRRPRRGRRVRRGPAAAGSPSAARPPRPHAASGCARGTAPQGAGARPATRGRLDAGAIGGAATRPAPTRAGRCRSRLGGAGSGAAPQRPASACATVRDWLGGPADDPVRRLGHRARRMAAHRARGRRGDRRGHRLQPPTPPTCTGTEPLLPWLAQAGILGLLLLLPARRAARSPAAPIGGARRARCRSPRSSSRSAAAGGAAGGRSRSRSCSAVAWLVGVARRGRACRDAAARADAGRARREPRDRGPQRRRRPLELRAGVPAHASDHGRRRLADHRVAGRAASSASAPRRRARCSAGSPPTGSSSLAEGRELQLTKPGRAAADGIFRRHALCEWLLTEIVGLGWAESDDEAERLQAAISPRVEARLDELLGHPQTCPHGNPIDAETARRRPPGDPARRDRGRRAGDDLPDHRGGRGGRRAAVVPRGARRSGPGAHVTILARSESLDSLTLDGPLGRATLGLRPAALVHVLPGEADPALFHRVPGR